MAQALPAAEDCARLLGDPRDGAGGHERAAGFIVVEFVGLGEAGDAHIENRVSQALKTLRGRTGGSHHGSHFTG